MTRTNDPRILNEDPQEDNRTVLEFLTTTRPRADWPGVIPVLAALALKYHDALLALTHYVHQPSNQWAGDFDYQAELRHLRRLAGEALDNPPRMDLWVRDVCSQPKPDPPSEPNRWGHQVRVRQGCAPGEFPNTYLALYGRTSKWVDLPDGHYLLVPTTAPDAINQPQQDPGKEE